LLSRHVVPLASRCRLAAIGALIRGAGAADHKQIAQLQTEVDHCIAAITSGLLSPALRANLQTVEAELARLQAQARAVKRSTAIIVPNVRGRITGWPDAWRMR
jgi:hypothetical protein